jgi:hypothetical protein
MGTPPSVCLAYAQEPVRVSIAWQNDVRFMKKKDILLLLRHSRADVKPRSEMTACEEAAASEVCPSHATGPSPMTPGSSVRSCRAFSCCSGEVLTGASSEVSNRFIRRRIRYERDLYQSRFMFILRARFRRPLNRVEETARSSIW